MALADWSNLDLLGLALLVIAASALLAFLVACSLASAASPANSTLFSPEGLAAELALLSLMAALVLAADSFTNASLAKSNSSPAVNFPLTIGSTGNWYRPESTCSESWPLLATATLAAKSVTLLFFSCSTVNLAFINCSLVILWLLIVLCCDCNNCW